MSTALTPQEEIGLLIAARYPVIQIVTGEERLVERAAASAAAAAGFQPFLWDFAGSLDGSREHQFAWRVQALDQLVGEPLVDPKKDPVGAVLRRIANRPDVAGFKAARDRDPSAEAALHGMTDEQGNDDRTTGREVWILRDVAPALKSDRLRRALKNLASHLGDTIAHDRLATVILIGESDVVPADLEQTIRLYRWPLPSRESRKQLVGEFMGLARVPDPARPGELLAVKIKDGGREDVVDAAAGLTAEAAGAALNESVARYGELRPVFIAAQKKLQVDGVAGLTWVDPDPLGLDAIGGLDELRRWVEEQKEPFLARSRPDSAAARYGLLPPRGIALLGEPGNGKSLMSQVVPAAWGVPFIQLDLGGLKGSLMGESEANMRKAMAVIEGAAPVVVQIDEAEKALAGSGSRLDAGVGAHQLKALLTVLSEGKAAVFFILTINDVGAVLSSYPELFRKGRMDLIFRLARPELEERAAIAAVHLRRAEARRLTAGAPAGMCDPDRFDLDAVARATDAFSGAEIAALVPAALLLAYRDRDPGDEEPREVTTEDLVVCARLTTPQSKIVQISPELQRFYETAARPASTPPTTDDRTTDGAVILGRGLRVPVHQGEN